MRALIALLFIALFSSQLIAENIDECKTDIYFANGVGAISKFDSFMQGYRQILAYEIATPSTQPFIGKYDLAFNTGHGVALDFFEAWLQYTDENPSAQFGWEAFKTAIGRLTVIGGGAVELSAAVARTHEAYDISKQVKAYEESIKLGHGVLVLAHSQGNFFTNKAYNSDSGIAPWMRDYFITVGLASPSDIKIPHSSYLTYDNDPISVLNGSGAIVRNPMRYYEWLAGPNAIVDSSSTVPCVPVRIADGDTPMCNDSDWYAEDSSLDDFHAFDYYMQTSATQADIYNHLTYLIELHNNSIFTPSQWELDQEKNVGTKDYKITLKHRFDSSIAVLNDIEVYPFNPSAKLYHVIDNTGGNGWVKATCGGEEVFDYWEDKKDNEFYMLYGTNPSEYIKSTICQDSSIFEIISHENIRTVNWRVTVKNTKTNEITKGVYPFNLNGSLYKLENNDFVIASCGGVKILNSWEGKNSLEDYKLQGTDEIIESKSVKVRSIDISWRVDECEASNCPLLTSDMTNKGDFLGVQYWGNFIDVTLFKYEYLPNGYSQFPTGFPDGWMMEAIGPAKAELYKGIDNANVIYYTEKIWIVPNDSSAWLDGISLGLYYK